MANQKLGFCELKIIALLNRIIIIKKKLALMFWGFLNWMQREIIGMTSS